MKISSAKNMLATLATCSLLAACGSDNDSNKDQTSRDLGAGKVKTLS